jgi:hypothetical protein
LPSGQIKESWEPSRRRLAGFIFFDVWFFCSFPSSSFLQFSFAVSFLSNSGFPSQQIQQMGRRSPTDQAILQFLNRPGVSTPALLQAVLPILASLRASNHGILGHSLMNQNEVHGHLLEAMARLKARCPNIQDWRLIDLIGTDFVGNPCRKPQGLSVISDNQW